MRVLKVLFMGIIVSVFLVGQAYSAPKGNQGKENQGKSNKNANANQAKANNGKANAQANNGNRIAAQNQGQAAVHKQQARRANEAHQKREARNRDNQRNLNDDNNDLAFNNNRVNKINDKRDHGKEMRAEKKPGGIDLLDALNHARWAHNPNDDRGQGNMGKVDMLDPFGHDKDSDRKELYGNNGRPIRVSEEPEVGENPPPPITEEELALLDATIDFSS